MATNQQGQGPVAMSNLLTALPVFRITQLRHEAGYWQARVSVNGDTLDVDRRCGSWQASVRDAPRASTFHRRELHPEVAAALQVRVRPLEKREQKLAADTPVPPAERKAHAPQPVPEPVQGAEPLTMACALLKHTACTAGAEGCGCSCHRVPS